VVLYRETRNPVLDEGVKANSPHSHRPGQCSVAADNPTAPAAPVTKIGLASDDCPFISTDIRQFPRNYETRVARLVDSGNPISRM
jgi:hypothetical protein